MTNKHLYLEIKQFNRLNIAKFQYISIPSFTHCNTYAIISKLDCGSNCETASSLIKLSKWYE